MVTNIIKYVYDPTQNRLTVLLNDKPQGGFVGEIANRKFMELLNNDINNISIGVTDMKSAKIRQLRALWIKQNIDQYRDSILEPYGVTSTADLTEKQLDELILRFSHNKNHIADDDVRQERSVVLKLLTQMNIYKNDSNWDRVNAFLMDNRIAGKLLYEMNLEELKQLAIKLRSIKSKMDKDNEYLTKISNLN